MRGLLGFPAPGHCREGLPAVACPGSCLGFPGGARRGDGMRGGAIVLGLLVAASSDLSAQPARPASQPGAETAAVPDAVGDWSNASQIDSGAMPVAIHIRREAGLLAGTLDVP